MRKRTYWTFIGIICFINVSNQSLPQTPISLISNRISDNVIIVSRENGSGNQLALNTDKGIVVFNSNWGTEIQLEYNKIIENEFNSKNYNFIINTGSNIRETGGNVLFNNLSIIAQKDHCNQMIENQDNLENLVQGQITVFTRKAERSRNILKGDDFSKDDHVLHSNWMKYCQRIADDLKSGYELVLPSIIFERQLILDLGKDWERLGRTY
ncbi:MAG: hypothetical protein K8R58_13540 [Bacteroidales bacterium]|nr:hypothetical protein [Bacteroidales bacterium]